MDCKAAGELGARLLDWDLSAQEQADLQLHLAGCPDCRAALDGLLTLNQAIVRLREDQADPPADLAAGVMARVSAAPPLRLAAARTRAAFLRRLHDLALVFRTPGRVRAAVVTGTLTAAGVVAAVSLYLASPGPWSTVAVVNPVSPPAVTRSNSVVPPAQTTTPATTPGQSTAKASTPAKGSTPAKANTPANTGSNQAATNQTEVAAAEGTPSTTTSIWLSATDVNAVNQRLSAAAGQYKADYHVYSLASAPNGQNKEFVRIKVNPGASNAIMDQIRSSAASVSRVVKNQTGSGGQDVIVAWVNGPEN